MIKTCSNLECTTPNPQPQGNFFKRSDRLSGLASQCKNCCRLSLNKYRKLNPTKLAMKQRRSALKRLYFKDLTPTAAEQLWGNMYTEQGGLCGICKINPATDTDHDHTTGKVRGLLCNPCNLILGKIEKRPGFIENTLRYLEAAK